MARVHVLDGDGNRTYRVVLHEPVPVGNNVAGVSWRDAVVRSGWGGSTVMSVGTLPGQITVEEQAQVSSGEIFEHVFQFQDDSAWTPAERQQALQTQINNASSEVQARVAKGLRLFGLTRG